MTNQAKIVVTAEDRASAVLRQVRGSVDSTVELFGRFSGALAALGVGAAAVGVARAIGALDDLAEAAKGVGLSAEDLSAFQLSATAAGVSAEELSGGIAKFAEVLSAARDGSEEAENTVKALGINLQQLRAGSVTTASALETAADALSKYGDGFEKTALARDAFGRGGAKFISFLSEGSEGLRKFGGVSREAVEEASKLQGEIDQLSASWQQLKLSVGGAIAGIINATLELKRGSLDAQLETTRRALDEISNALENASPGSRIERNLLAQLVAEQKKLQDLEKALSRRDFVGPPEDLARPPAKPGKKDKPEKSRAEEISESRRELSAFIEQLQRQADITEEITLQEKAQRLLRANPSIDTPQVRERLQLEIQRVEQAEQEKQIREEIARINKETIEQERRLREEIFELAGIADESRKIALTEQFEILLQTYKFTDEQKEKIVKGIAGIKDEVQQTREAAEQFALTLSSSLGSFIERGGSVRDFFDALLQDILKLTTQLLIIKPLAEGLTEVFGGTAAKSGGGKQIAGLFGSLGSLFSGFFADGGFIPPGRFGVVGERGPELAFGGRSGQTIQPMGGNVSIAINVPGGTNRDSANQIALATGRAVQRAMRRYG